MEEYRNLLPRNMRQMGEKEDRVRIYVEDYVCTYFHKLELTTECWRVGVLLGVYEEREGIPCLFISGAVETQAAEYAEGRLKFTDKTWSDILRKMERFFPGMGVCGWFVYEKSGGMVDKLSLKRTYEETFAQGSKVLLLHDDQDEEAFYILWKGKMTRMSGYYIYYERNRNMQAYISRETLSGEEKEGAERVIEEFRARMEEKQTQGRGDGRRFPQISEQNRQRMKNAAVCAASLILLISAISYGQQLRGLKKTVGDYIALEAESEAAATVSAPVLYLPSPGETLRGVCRRIYGSLDRLDELEKLNEIEDPDEVLSEQWLKLP